MKRDMTYSKEIFLWYLYNKLGHKELEITCSFQGNNGLWFTPWVKFEVLLHLNPEGIVPRQKKLITKEQFIKQASHRTVHPGEVLLDIDDVKWRDGYSFPTIKEKAKTIYNELIKLNKRPIVYFTGSKSYHISLFDINIALKPARERRDIKQQVIEYYHCDGMMSSPRKMVSMEGVPHYKSGKIKKEVFWDYEEEDEDEHEEE